MKLRAWREGEGLTQAQVGALLGVTQQAYGRYENGREPEPAIARRIVHVSKGAVTMDDLYGAVAVDEPEAPEPSAEVAA